jgi:hypothetical protein
MSSAQGHVYAGDVHSYGGPIFQGNITGDVHLGSLSNLQKKLLTINIAFSTEHVTKDQEVYDWLSPLNFWNTQVDVYDRWHEGTGGWFLDHLSVRKWIKNSNENLFCTGKRMPPS